MLNNEIMSTSILKVSGIVVLCAILFIPSGMYLAKLQKNSTPFLSPQNPSNFSQDILYITNPVITLTGKVDKKESNSLVLVHSSPELISSSSPVSAQPKIRISTYKVKVTKNTRVFKTVPLIPYLAKPISPQVQSEGAVADIQAGQNVTVTADVDLRLNTTNEFDAVSIQLTPPINTVQGMITSVTSSGLTVKGVVRKQIFELSQGDGNAKEEKVFTFAVSSDTEISRFSAPTLSKPGETANLGAPKVEILSLKDLAVGNQVVVYAGQDVTKSQSLTALRVEPIGTIPDNTRLPSPPQLSPTASGAAETKKLE